MWNGKEENTQPPADTPEVRPDEGTIVRVVDWLPKDGRHFVWFDDCDLMTISPALAAATLEAVSGR